MKQRFGITKCEEPSHVNSALSSVREGESSKTSKKKRKKTLKQGNFVGTSTALEKEYLRLTDYPKAENVRPLRILMKSLAHIKSQYIKNEDFDWANEQLKSLRQDLTVQNIRNKFSLDVYETHSRLLIEHGDLNEFRQCQSMIQSLTAPQHNLDSSSQHTDEIGAAFQLVSQDEDNEEVLQQSREAADEFYAYDLLYHLIQNSWGELTRLLSIHGNWQHEYKNSARNSHTSPFLCGHAVRHALNVVKSVMHHDYQSFFRLYESPPHLIGYLMDFIVRRVRKCAYHRMIASYRPTLSVEHFRMALAFDDLEETRRFLKENDAKFIHELGAPPFYVDCKATLHVIPRSVVSGNDRVMSG